MPGQHSLLQSGTISQIAGAIIQRRRSPAVNVDFVILVYRHSSSASRAGFLIFTCRSHVELPPQLVIYLTDMASFLTQTFTSLSLTPASKSYHCEKPKQATRFVEAARFFSTEPLF